MRIERAVAAAHWRVVQAARDALRTPLVLKLDPAFGVILLLVAAGAHAALALLGALRREIDAQDLRAHAG